MTKFQKKTYDLSKSTFVISNETRGSDSRNLSDVLTCRSIFVLSNVDQVIDCRELIDIRWVIFDLSTKKGLEPIEN